MSFKAVYEFGDGRVLTDVEAKISVPVADQNKIKST